MKIVEIVYNDVTEVHDVEEATLNEELPIRVNVTGRLAYKDDNYYWLITSYQSNKKHEILIIPRGCVIELRSLQK